MFKDCHEVEAPAFIRKKSFSVDPVPQEYTGGVWNSIRNKAEQFFGLRDSVVEDEATEDVWEDAADDDLDNISLLVHQVLDPPPRDSYCVAVHK